MLSLLFSALLTTAPSETPAPAPADCGSYLYQPAFCIDDQLRGPAEPYTPQPGDIMLRMDNSIFWRVTHYMALAFDPNGSGLVYARPDGTLAVLEAGPNDTLWVGSPDCLPHLKEYAEARVWIRRRRCPLTPEQSAKLTAFACAQDGKRFALIRLGGQLTPFRNRGPIRTRFLGKPCGDRRAWFCSELVCESCVAAGLMDPETTRPSCTFPRDLFYGHSFNPYLNSHLRVNDDWYPPARWTDHP